MQKCQRRVGKIYKKLNKGFHRYINGTKGVISLFLAILMLPFATIAGSLINAARIDSAVAIFDEALCNASNSTLGTYDSFLRKRFGLLAMSQNTASKGAGYTAQDLISETFEFYMEQNLGALSNTYTSFDVSAAGVYPLADTDVLLSQVMDASKYTVPAKLVIDGLSLDDLLKNLTKSLSLASSIFDTLSSGATMGDNMAQCEEKFKTLTEKVKASETANAEYDAAYNAFVTAVNAYNPLIDEFNQERSKKQTAVDNATTKRDECQATYDEAKAAYDALVAAGEDLKKHKTEVDAYEDAEEALEKANGDLTSANNALTTVINTYTSKLSEKRSAVTTAKSTYVIKIDAFASALKATGEAVIDAQSSVNTAINSGVDFAGKIGNTLYEGQKTSINNQIEDMKNSKKAAEERGDNTAAYLWDDQIKDAQKQQTEIADENKIYSAYTSTYSTAIKSLDSFQKEDYKTLYSQAYGSLIELKGEVESYVVHTDNTTKLADASSYYRIIDTILTTADVAKIEEDLAGEIGKSSFIALINAIVGFIKAIFSLTVWFDPTLNATIDTNKYSSIGGLPSMKDRSEGSPYSLKSEFADIDQQKSDYYKGLLSDYSNNPVVAGNAATMLDLITTIMENIEKIVNLPKWGFGTVFSNLKTIAKAIGNIITTYISFITNLQKIIVNAISQKILLAGYVAYNIPNRTTYTKKALNGATYALPNMHSAQQGYAFYGAETEYIINGSLSEISNQTNMFHIVYLLRGIYNIPVILLNSEVATFAGEAAACSLGIGYFVVYILYIIAEPFVDTLILVNAGSVPVIKRKVYLTPGGIPDLIKCFYKLSLSDDLKNKAYKEVIKVATLEKASDEFAENYEPPKVPEGNKFTQSWDFDYTKTLIIVMTLFTGTDTMVSRLSDIIQMEASYDAVNRIDKYTFNLDQSYTYLRASGTFEANEFIKISNGTGLKSKERVVYRGY